jgi:hypothetical protein
MKKKLLILTLIIFSQTNAWSFGGLGKALGQLKDDGKSALQKAKDKISTAAGNAAGKIQSGISNAAGKIQSGASSAAGKIPTPGQPSKSTPAKIISGSKKIIKAPVTAISNTAKISIRDTLNKKNPYRHCDNVKSPKKGTRLAYCPSGMLPTPLQIKDHPGQNKGLVRQGSDIPKAERGIVNGGTNDLRSSSVKQAILTSKLTSDLKLQYNLRIAFCGSGGGDRAMLSTLGFLSGAEKTGLLDMVTYMAALSGSTWTQGAWLTSGKKLSDVKKHLRSNLALPAFKVKDGLGTIPAIKKSEEIGRLIKNLVTKAVFEQDIGPVDLWGGLIANHIFRGLMHPRISLRMTKTQIPHLQPTTSNSPTFPFPIYTAVSGDHQQGYKWYEFTPIECGSSELGSGYWCPTWAFGRKINKGISKKWKTLTSPIKGTEYAPEQALGYFLGICGSAFTVNVGEIIKMIQDGQDAAMQNKSTSYKKLVGTILNYIKDSNAGTKSVHPAKISNFTYGIDGSPIKDQKEIMLRDAGLHFNLPLPPLLRKERQIDIIFVFDASGNILDDPGAEIKAANKWASKNGVSLPDFSKVPNLGKEAVTIIDSDKNAPVIVYMPMFKDKKLTYTGAAKDFNLATCLKKDCSTFNFTYSNEEFDGLTALTEQNMILSIDKIKTALQEASKRAQSNQWYQLTN